MQQEYESESVNANPPTPPPLPRAHELVVVLEEEKHKQKEGARISRAEHIGVQQPSTVVVEHSGMQSMIFVQKIQMSTMVFDMFRCDYMASNWFF